LQSTLLPFNLIILTSILVTSVLHSWYCLALVVAVSSKFLDLRYSYILTSRSLLLFCTVEKKTIFLRTTSKLTITITITITISIRCVPYDKDQTSASARHTSHAHVRQRNIIINRAFMKRDRLCIIDLGNIIIIYILHCRHCINRAVKSPSPSFDLDTSVCSCCMELLRRSKIKWVEADILIRWPRGIIASTSCSGHTKSIFRV
jgi:hypothetical protein